MTTTPSANDVRVYDHFRPADGEDFPAGVYRVVGVGRDDVTLLRVGDSDGRRVNTGEVVTVDRATADRLRPADNPDGNRSAGATLWSAVTSAVWSVRAFLQQLAANPLPSAAAIGVLLAGQFGDSLGIPETAQAGLILLGAVGLVFAASGRP